MKFIIHTHDMSEVLAEDGTMVTMSDIASGANTFQVVVADSDDDTVIHDVLDQLAEDGVNTGLVVSKLTDNFYTQLLWNRKTQVSVDSLKVTVDDSNNATVMFGNERPMTVPMPAVIAFVKESGVQVCAH